MDKKKLIRVYLWLSVVLAAILYFVKQTFIKSMFSEGVTEMYGDIESSIFTYKLTNYTTTIDIFNTPLVLFIVFLVFAITVAVIASRGEKLDSKILTELLAYDAIIAFGLVAFNILFMILIPERIDGEFVNSFFKLTMERSGGNVSTMFNFVNIMLVIYIVLNVVILVLTREKTYKPKQKVEELDSEFL